MSSYILDDLKPDVKENDILKIDNELLSILLTDRSSGANIIWATGDYAETRGESDIKALGQYLGELVKSITL